ncbi:MAG: cyclic nucleotide-gated ion channel/potassium channel family protein [Magnetococcus sp. DMHC-6]
MKTKVKNSFQWLFGLLVEGPLPPMRARIYRKLIEFLILASTIITVVNTVPDAWGVHIREIHLIEIVTLIVMSVDYLLRLGAACLKVDDGRCASSLPPVFLYMFSPYGIFDFLAVAPFLFGELVGISADVEIVFGILRFLKLARYSTALETLWEVVLIEIRPLGAALFIIILLTLFTSGLLYFSERAVNPNFDNLPKAMWWSIVTLATLGYGDVVPITALGKMLGSVAVVLGLVMFALPASILATGFAEEMRRQNFLSTWNLIAKVNLFKGLSATQIAEVASLLKLYRCIRNEVLVREGDIGESMYFIVSGQVEVRSKEYRGILRSGDFFGEIALIEQCPRTADVVALSRCQLLVLESRDLNTLAGQQPKLMEILQTTARKRLIESERSN